MVVHCDISKLQHFALKFLIAIRLITGLQPGEFDVRRLSWLRVIVNAVLHAAFYNQCFAFRCCEGVLHLSILLATSFVLSFRQIESRNCVSEAIGNKKKVYEKTFGFEDIPCNRTMSGAV